MASTITASFGLDINPLKAGFNRAASLSASAAKNIGSRVSAFITHPLTAVSAAASGFLTYETFKHGIAGVIETGDELAKLSTKTGIAVGSLATLQGVFKAAEVPAESLGGSIAKMQRNLYAAARVGGPAGQAIRTLHLNADELIKLKPEDQFVAIGKAINGLPSPMLRTAEAMALFGKSGVELLPAFEELDNIDFGNLSAKAAILEKNAQKWDQINANFRKAKGGLNGVFYGLADAITPTLMGISKVLSKQSALNFGIELGRGIRTATDYLFGAFADPAALGDLVANGVMFGYATAGNFLLNNLARLAVRFSEDMLVGVDVIDRSLLAGIDIAADHFANSMHQIKAILLLAAGGFVDVILQGMIEAAKVLKQNTVGIEAVRLAQNVITEGMAKDALAHMKPARTFDQAFAQQPLSEAGKLAVSAIRGGMSSEDSDFFGAAGFAKGMRAKAEQLRKAGAPMVAALDKIGENAKKVPAAVGAVSRLSNNGGLSGATMAGNLGNTGGRNLSLIAGALLGGFGGAALLRNASPFTSKPFDMVSAFNRTPLLSAAERASFADAAVARGGARHASVGAYHAIRAGDTARRKAFEREQLIKKEGQEKANETLESILATLKEGLTDEA